MIEHVVAVGRLDFRPAEVRPRSGERLLTLVGGVTGETLYALRDPACLIPPGRIDGLVLVAGTVVGPARGLPLLEVARVDRLAPPRATASARQPSRGGRPG